MAADSATDLSTCFLTEAASVPQNRAGNHDGREPQPDHTETSPERLKLGTQASHWKNIRAMAQFGGFLPLTFPQTFYQSTAETGYSSRAKEVGDL